ncbi:MAG: hypothetical protein J6M93_00815, partial [Succinivibrio sp.]|nr:hypothetical protein [Succinivibrio sp.]
ERPTLMRLYQYIANSNLSLYVSVDSGVVKLLNMRASLANVFRALGESFSRYYSSSYYQGLT